jgi:hypothetical protein
VKKIRVSLLTRRQDAFEGKKSGRRRALIHPLFTKKPSIAKID